MISREHDDRSEVEVDGGLIRICPSGYLYSWTSGVGNPRRGGLHNLGARGWVLRKLDTCYPPGWGVYFQRTSLIY